MTADPTEPDTFQDSSPAPSAEAPEADAAEQLAELTPRDDEPPTGLESGEAADGDAAEQARVVAIDEDDYR